MSTGFMVLDLMVKNKDSRKFSFTELRRHLGYSTSALDSAIEEELRELLDMGTIGKIHNEVLGPLYYVSFSKQDPSCKLSMTVVCPEGRVQTTRTLNSAEDAPDAFRHYQWRLRNSEHKNPTITDEWIESLTYNVE